MTERERQIVYPLLVFALLMGLKGNFQPRLSFEARSIECAELKVSMINGKAVADSRFPMTVPLPARNTEAANDETIDDEATGDEATTSKTDADDPDATTDDTQTAEAAGESNESVEGNQETTRLTPTESDSGESSDAVEP